MNRQIMEAMTKSSISRLINRVHLLTGGELIYGGKELIASQFVYDSQFIGDTNMANWYIKNKLLVCPEHPNLVAITLKSHGEILKTWVQQKTSFPDTIKKLQEAGDVIGYYGYSRKGGQSFKIGDRLFDGSYEPKEEDFPKPMWIRWEAEVRARDLEDPLEKHIIKDAIPFTWRGFKEIKTWDEARQSAYNLGKYLS